MALAFANPYVQKIYYKLRQIEQASKSAIIDSQEAAPSVYNMDFSTIFPTISSKYNGPPNPSTDENDFFCYSVLDEISSYRGFINGRLVVSPLAILELWDNLKHRREYLSRVYKANTTDSMYRAIQTAIVQPDGT